MALRVPTGSTASHGRLTTTALLSVALVVPVGLAACGDDDETETSGATTSEQAGAPGGGQAGETISVSETEYKLDPGDPKIKAGEVTIEATNDGEIVHSLEVEGPGEEAELEQDLQPGDSGELTVDLSQPGKYEWYCPIDDHKERGMEGEITVQG